MYDISRWVFLLGSPKPDKVLLTFTLLYVKQEASLKMIIVEGYRAVGSLNDSFQSSNFLLLLLLFFIDFGQW